MKKRAKLLRYFRQYPFAALGILAIPEFGREAGIGVVVAAINSNKWGVTLAELIALSEQSRCTCRRYEEALQIIDDYEMMVQRTIELWLKLRSENFWTSRAPTEPLLSFLARTNETRILSGLKTMRDSGLITLCENNVASPTEDFFNRLLAGCRTGGLIVL